MEALKKKLVIINGNAELRRIYNLVIYGTEKYNVVGDYAAFEEVWNLFGRLSPDLVLIDIDLPGMNGIEATRLIRDNYPTTTVVIVTGSQNDESIFAAFRAGAMGYILRSANYVELINSLEEVIDGGAPLSRQIARRVVTSYHANPQSPLTKRETQIMQLVSQGKTYAEIAEEFNISGETSKTHIKNIYAKLKVNTKSQAIAKAKTEKLI